MNNTCFFNLEMDNLTFDDTTISSDKYVGVYESVHIRFAFLTTYMVILVFAPLLAFVIWFERSGQAGSYRTMVNQLASFNLDQVHFFHQPIHLLVQQKFLPELALKIINIDRNLFWFPAQLDSQGNFLGWTIGKGYIGHQEYIPYYLL